eukprot:jgi/Psemu1/24698/gm1.24698_g
MTPPSPQVKEPVLKYFTVSSGTNSAKGTHCGTANQSLRHQFLKLMAKQTPLMSHNGSYLARHSPCMISTCITAYLEQSTPAWNLCGSRRNFPGISPWTLNHSSIHLHPIMYRDEVRECCAIGPTQMPLGAIFQMGINVPDGVIDICNQ